MLDSQSDNPAGLLTPKQVAELFQIKLPRVYELVRYRRLKAIRIGRQLRFRPTAVEEFLTRNETRRNVE